MAYKQTFVLNPLAAVLVTSAILALATPNALTQPLKRAQCLRNLNTYLTEANNTRAGFEKRVWDSEGKLIDNSRGRMAIARPHRFRWIPKQSLHPIIIANREYLWIYDRDMEQAVRKPISALMSDNPAGLLSDSTKTLNQQFILKGCHQKQQKSDWFFLKPKQKQTLIKSLVLVFKKKSLVMMQVTDTLGHKSQINFTAVKHPTHLSEALFHFKPPHGVDVIKSLQ